MMVTEPAVTPSNFNPHASVTSDGTLITDGLRVWTNNLDRGVVTADRDMDRCCGDVMLHGQVKVDGAWFTDHKSGQDCSCRHNHWFTVTLDDGRSQMMDGERMAVRFRGERA